MEERNLDSQMQPIRLMEVNFDPNVGEISISTHKDISYEELLKIQFDINSYIQEYSLKLQEEQNQFLRQAVINIDASNKLILETQKALLKVMQTLVE